MIDLIELHRQGHLVLEQIKCQREYNKLQAQKNIEAKLSFLPSFLASAVALCCVSDKTRRVPSDFVIKTRYGIVIYNDHEIRLQQHLSTLSDNFITGDVPSSHVTQKIQVCIASLKHMIQPEVEQQYYVSMSGN